MGTELIKLGSTILGSVIGLAVGEVIYLVFNPGNTEPRREKTPSEKPVLLNFKENPIGLTVGLVVVIGLFLAPFLSK